MNKISDESIKRSCVHPKKGCAETDCSRAVSHLRRSRRKNALNIRVPRSGHTNSIYAVQRRSWGNGTVLMGTRG